MHEDMKYFIADYDDEDVDKMMRIVDKWNIEVKS